MKFRRATYIGWHGGLKGQGALLRPSHIVGRVLAQFDDRALVYIDQKVGFGWHEFRATDFDGDNLHDWEEDDE